MMEENNTSVSTQPAGAPLNPSDTHFLYSWIKQEVSSILLLSADDAPLTSAVYRNPNVSVAALTSTDAEY